MQVDTDDRYIDESRQRGLPRLPIALLILAVVVGVAWYFTPGEPETEAPPALVTPVPAESPAEPGRAEAPDIPEPVTVVAESDPATDVVAAEPEPMLALEESDPAVREVFTGTLDDSVFALSLEQDNLLERGAALFGAAANGAVLREVFPFPAPQGKFAVIEVDGKLLIDPQSYQRYDGYAAAVAALDTESLAATFHRFRPLLEEAYGNLGYRAEDMDNSLIAALDQLIAVPELEEPAVLVADVATYTYEDETLENLSPLAKQLLRMGPQNQAIIQRQARALRAALLGE